MLSYLSLWIYELLLPANEVWGKVIFSQVSVILLTGGSASVHAGIPPSKENPPPGRAPLPGRHPIQGDPPPGRPPFRESPLRETPLQGDPPPGPHPGGKLRRGSDQGKWLRGNWGGSGPGPQPRGKLRGIRSRPTPKGKIEGDQIRPTPKGEIEGGQIQAHTQGGYWGGSDPDPPMTTTAVGSTHPTGMHSCIKFSIRLFTRKDTYIYIYIYIYIYGYKLERVVRTSFNCFSFQRKTDIVLY